MRGFFLKMQIDIFQNGFDRFVMFNRLTASEEVALNFTSYAGPEHAKCDAINILTNDMFGLKYL